MSGECLYDHKGHARARPSASTEAPKIGRLIVKQLQIIEFACILAILAGLVRVLAPLRRRNRRRWRSPARCFSRDLESAGVLQRLQ